MDAPGSDAGKEEAVGKQEADILKPIPGSEVISTVEKEGKENNCQTGLAIVDVAKSEVNKTEVATKEVNKTEVATKEVNKTEVATKEVNKTDVVIPEVNKTDVAKSEVNKTEVATSEANKAEVVTADINKTEVATKKVNKTDVVTPDIDKTDVAKSVVNTMQVSTTEETKTDLAKQEVPQTELVKPELDKAEVGKAELAETEVVKAEAIVAEIAKARVDETKVEKVQQRVTDSEPAAAATQPESVKPETEMVRTEPDAAHNTELAAVRKGPEVANIDPEVNKATPAEPGPGSNGTGQTIVKPEAKGVATEAAVKEPQRSSVLSAGPSVGSTQRSAMTRTRYSIESDSEISEILRDAPPPTPWEEEDDGAPVETGDEGTTRDGGTTGDGGRTGDGEASGDMETIVIMKKTFTESVKPDQEFIPISDDSDSSAPIRNSVPTLRTLVVPAATTAQKVANNLAKEAGHVIENGAGEATNDAERTSDDQSILSKAQMEAQDLTSEFRRLQYLLENLSALGDLELAPVVELPASQEPVELQNLNPVSSQLSAMTEPGVERF